jgi:radical SAM/Cys-rich protein
MMDADTAALVLQVLRARAVHHAGPDRRCARAEPALSRPGARCAPLGVRVIDRCNLTILSEPGQEDLAAFLAEQQVEVVASLPCYSVANVDRQRGEGVFDRSIAGLRQLNALGYGQPGTGLVLNLVYNPQGAVLPPPQGPLQADYKRELASHFGIVFNQLFALTNMPIQRFGSTLVSKGTFQAATCNCSRTPTSRTTWPP